MLGLNGFANDPNWILDPAHDYPRLAWQGTPGEIIPEPNIAWLAGRGTREDPYQIRTAEQLRFLGRAGVLCTRHVVLCEDINLDASLPDRQVFTQAVIPTFMGVFDGNGHVISKVAIEGASYLGVFGQLTSEASVSNLGVVDVSVVGSGSCVGGLVGHNEGTIASSYSTGAVDAKDDVGGLVGNNVGTITRCYSSVGVIGNRQIGGLVGCNHWGSITMSHSTGVVRGNGSVGGLAGRNWGALITQCYSAATVSGESDVGGLVGDSRGRIATSYSAAVVSGGSRVGGLLGCNARWGGAVTDCYSIGVVVGSGEYVGALVGLSYGVISASFWDIQASGQDRSDGGTGLTTIEMQTASTFLDAGWDFVGETDNGTDDIWWIDEGQDYPRLWWELSIDE
jgi:hypothetical protein